MSISSITLKKVRDRLAKLKADRDDLNRRIAGFEVFLEDIESNPDAWDALPSSASLMNDAMAHILKDAGAPIHYRAIYAELRRRQIPVAGENPARNVGAHLSLDEKFVAFGDGKWGLADWQEEAKELETVSEPDAIADDIDDLPF